VCACVRAGFRLFGSGFRKSAPDFDIYAGRFRILVAFRGSRGFRFLGGPYRSEVLPCLFVVVLCGDW